MIAITLPLPPSSNRYWRKWNNRMVKSDEARDYQMRVSMLCYEYVIEPTDKPVVLSLHIYFNRRGKNDLTNRIKILEDALNGIIWEDDNQIIELHAYKHYDKANPRVELTARVIEGEESASS